MPTKEKNRQRREAAARSARLPTERRRARGSNQRPADFQSALEWGI